jgi:GTP:adenosylcobinamide-phosphate guanylyltransferase
VAKLDVVIPAGGVIEEEFARVVGTDSKALIKFNEQSVLKRTIDTLKSSPVIGRILVVGSPTVMKSEDVELADHAIPAVGSSPANIKAGLEYYAGLDLPPHQVLIVTADLPFLSLDAIHDFLKLCDGDMDLYIPLVAQKDWDEAYPGTDAMFVTLLDGSWTTGCMYMMTVRGFKIGYPYFERVFEKRKSKLGMAALLGWKFVWDYKMKKLTVTDIEKKIVSLLKINGVAVPGSPPELAYDIDYLEDYHYALSTYKARAVKEAAERAAQGDES